MYFTKSNHYPWLKKKKIIKIREYSDFNEIFSVDLLMIEFYNALVILFKNFPMFFRSFNHDPLIFVVQNLKVFFNSVFLDIVTQ